MDPQCHPELSRATSETDLQAEQDEFFLSGAVNSVKMVNAAQKVTYIPSVSVLDEVYERDTTDTAVAPPKPPVIKAPLKPTKIVRKTPTASPTGEPENNLSTEALKEKVSHENDEKLSKMTAEEIEELKREVLESVPESFLNKLRNK